MGLFSIFGEDDNEFTGANSGSIEQDKANSAAGVAKYGGGYELGSNHTQGEKQPLAFGGSAVRADQTPAERLAEQRADFFYGGTATGMEDAKGELRGNMQPWLTGFGALGSTYGDNRYGAAGRQAPIYKEGLAGYWDDRGSALNAAQDLYSRAQQGPGPSQAQAQLDASTAQGLRQQLMLAGSGRGAGGGASAFRQAAANQATMQGQANANAAALRAQEEAAWRQQQANMIGQASALYQQQQAQDLAAAGYYTGAQQQQTQLNDALGLGYGQLELGAAQAGAQSQLATEQGAHSINMGGLSGSMGYEELMSQIYGINMGHAIDDRKIDQQEEAARVAFLGTLYSGAGAQSDIRSKKDIEPAEDEVTGMLRRLGVEQEAERKTQPTMAEQYAKRTGAGTTINPYGDADLSKVDFRLNDIRDPYASDLPKRGSMQPTARENEAANAWRSELASVPTARFADAAADTARATSASSYQYKDPERHGVGTFYGPMAQELEKTPAGASLVHEQADGTKAVDGGRAGLLALSAAGTQQRQQDDFAARMAEADKKIAELEQRLLEDDERKKKRSGFDVDLSAPDTDGMDEVSRREGAYRP